MHNIVCACVCDTVCVQTRPYFYCTVQVVNRRGHGITADWWSFGVLMVSTK